MELTQKTLVSGYLSLRVRIVVYLCKVGVLCAWQEASKERRTIETHHWGHHQIADNRFKDNTRRLLYSETNSGFHPMICRYIDATAWTKNAYLGPMDTLTRCAHSQVNGITRIQDEDYLHCRAQGAKHGEGGHSKVRVLTTKQQSIVYTEDCHTKQEMFPSSNPHLHSSGHRRLI